MTGGGASAGEDGGRAEWLRIYDRIVAMLRKSQAQVQALAADRSRLEAFVKIQHELWVARDARNQARLHQIHKAEASRRRCEEAGNKLLVEDQEREVRRYQMLAELQDDDLEDYKTCILALSAENASIKLKPKDVEGHVELGERSADHEQSTRDMRSELRKLKEAYKTLSSKKDREVSSLIAEKDFVWNQLKEMDKDHTKILKMKKLEAAHATEAAQKLQKNVDELQVAAKEKDDEIARLRAEAVEAKNKLLILEDKLKEKDDKIERLKVGHSVTSQKRKKNTNGTHRKSRSEGPSKRKSKNNSRRQMVEEDEQPETSQKRNSASSLQIGLRRCSSRLQSRSPVLQLPAPELFNSNFKVPKLRTPTHPQSSSM